MAGGIQADSSKLTRREALGVIGGMVAGTAFSTNATGARERKERSVETRRATPGGEASPDEVQPIRGKGPNILMIMSDQHRADWLGCAGADWVRTPNLDSLLSEGVLFRQAICNYPLCAPSRAALASGLRASQVGVMGNNYIYPYHVPTYYQALRAAGYRVGCVGKTDLHKRDHWEGENGDRPLMYHLGFTDPYELEGKQTGASDHGKPACPYQHYLVKKGLFDKFSHDYNVARKEYPRRYGADSILPLDAYEDAFIGDHACEFLETVSEESPWHYFVSFVGPHNPWDAPKEYADRYRAAEMPEAIADPMEDKPARHTKAAERHKDMTRDDLVNAMRQYAGMITLIDDYVGRMLGILEKRGMREDTVIIYCSDHGEMMGDHGLFFKSWFYEASVRVPLLISGPGISARGMSDALVELYDLAPTCVELGQAESQGKMTAKSLVPLLRGEQTSIRDYQISEMKGERMIFDGRYKMIEDSRGPSELYDLEADPKELRNLVEAEAERAQRMSGILADVLASES